MLIFASSMEDAKSVYLFNDRSPFDIYFVLFTEFIVLIFVDVNSMKEKIFSYYYSE